MVLDDVEGGISEALSGYPRLIAKYLYISYFNLPPSPVNAGLG